MKSGDRDSEVNVQGRSFARLFFFVASILLLGQFVFSATIGTRGVTSTRKHRRVTENQRARGHMSHLARSRRVRARAVSSLRRHHYYERFYASSFADDITDGDITAGEDPIVRQAAIEAMGNMNGTVVAIEPTSGRILAMVNQKLALSSGAQPCSTIKLSVALAALTEGIITPETQVRLGGRWHMNLTLALAHSNNAYFEALGRQLGFEKVAHYAHLYGLGELAGYHIPGETPGVYPDEVIPAKLGGVGKMCSFGEGITMTPLQLASLVTAIANGGTMYYLQHPTTPAEIASFQPIVKRHLDIAGLIPQISDGMAGAVEYGTARSLLTNFSEEEVLGKTGTCSHAGTRFGWFGSYANTNYGRIVVVVFLQGGRPTFGPKAAEIAGRMYRGLYDHDFFVEKPQPTPVRNASSTD